MNSILFQLCTLFFLLAVCESTLNQESYIFSTKVGGFFGTSTKGNNQTGESSFHYTTTKTEYSREAKKMIQELRLLYRQTAGMLKTFRISEIQGDDPIFNMTFLHIAIWLTVFVCTFVFIKK